MAILLPFKIPSWPDMFLFSSRFISFTHGSMYAWGYEATLWRIGIHAALCMLWVAILLSFKIVSMSGDYNVLGKWVLTYWERATRDRVVVVPRFWLFLIPFPVGAKRWGDACAYQAPPHVWPQASKLAQRWSLVGTCITSSFRSPNNIRHIKY